MKRIIGGILIVLGIIPASSAFSLLHMDNLGYGKLWLNIVDALPVGDVLVSTTEACTYVIAGVLVIVGVVLIVRR